MVEVVHVYHGTYPFGMEKESENTFVQEIKQNLDEYEITLLRQKTKIYRSINSPHFIKLNKILKEDTNLYFIYQYQSASLESFIESLKKNGQVGISRDRFKGLALEFKINIDNIIEALIKAQIKTDLTLSNLAHAPKIQKDSNYILKAFIDSNAQYLSLIQHHYKPKDSKKKDRQGTNQQYLSQFYQSERKRLIVQFQQLVQKVFGKISEPIQRKQSPNFVINGTKLIFINPNQKQKQIPSQNIEKNIKKDHIYQIQQKQKNQVKLQPIKKNQQIESKNNGQENNMTTKSNAEKTRTEIDLKQKKQIKGPIVDFDQSFEPQFKPQEFTKQKTYIYQQTDYLNSLQDELKKITGDNNTPQAKNLDCKQQYKAIKNNQAKLKPQPNIEKGTENKQKKQGKVYDLTISQGSTQSQSNGNNKSNNISNQNISSNNDSYEKKQIKGEKLNKYKMKIITSHQIEIEGGGEEGNVQELQKQIIKGIKSGKITMNDLTTNNQKISIPSKNQSGQNSYDSITPKTDIKSNNNEQQIHKQRYVNNQQRCQNILKQQRTYEQKQQRTYEQKQLRKYDQKQQRKNQQKQQRKYEQKQQRTYEQQQHRSTAKQKINPPNRARTINEIIQRIGLKSNANFPSAEQQQAQNKSIQHEEIKQQQPSALMTQATLAVHRFQKNDKIEKIDKIQGHVVGEHADEKNQKTQNYMTKIREAKNKAEQILREYTKRKQ